MGSPKMADSPEPADAVIVPQNITNAPAHRGVYTYLYTYTRMFA